MTVFIMFLAVIVATLCASLASSLVQKMGAPIWAVWMTWIIVWAVVLTAFGGGCRSSS